MSNSHEPSYYEIALTNRQVVVAFVILLVCLLSAFFSGVWVGKSGAEPAGEQVVRAAPPPPEPTEGANLEELEFFDQPGGRQAAPAASSAATSPAAETPGAETTLREDLEGPDAGEPEPPRPSPSPTVSPSPRPAPPSPSPTPRDERAEDRSEEIVRPRPLPETERRTEPAREPAAGSVVIQVFASPEQGEARRIRDRLAQGGQKAYLSPVTVDGRTMYRVRIGPFGNREDAQEVAETVRKTYKLDTWVTQ